MTGKPKKYNKHFAATIEDFTRTLLPFSPSMRQHQTACSKPPETQGAKFLCLFLSPPKSLFFFPAKKMQRKEEKRKRDVLSELRSCYSLSLSAPPPPPRTLPHRVETSLRLPFPHTDRRFMQSLLHGKRLTMIFFEKDRQKTTSKLSLSLSLSLLVSCVLCSQWCSQTVVVETAAMARLDPTETAPGRKGSKRWKQQQKLRART
jgi:hypothetical protein